VSQTEYGKGGHKYMRISYRKTEECRRLSHPGLNISRYQFDESLKVKIVTLFVNKDLCSQNQYTSVR
jgi:hypothetical protein